MPPDHIDPVPPGSPIALALLEAARRAPEAATEILAQVDGYHQAHVAEGGDPGDEPVR